MALPDPSTLVSLYISGQVKSARQLAARFDVSHEWAAQRLNRALVEAGHPPLQPRGKKPLPTKEDLIQWTQVDRYPLARRDIYGASAATVLKWLDHYGLPHPNGWDTRRAAQNRSTQAAA